MIAGGGFPRGCGILVVGHGTADRVGEAETRTLVGQVVDACPGGLVELGFLEVIGPSVAEGLRRLIARGVDRVVAAPLLLFSAGHARRDLPDALAAAAADAAMAVVQAAPLGHHPELVRLSRRRREEARHPLPPLDPADEALVFVGRGASDPSATGQLITFLEATRACAARGLCRPGEPAASCGRAVRPAVCAAVPIPPGPGRQGVGFVAAARPTVDEALDEIVDPSRPGGVPRRVLVQPHLLFRGRVEEQVLEAVDRARTRHPAIEWVVIPRLGAAPEVARALVARAMEALVPVSAA